MPSNKIPTSQHWKSPSQTELSHCLHLLQSKCGQSSSQLLGSWWVLVLGMSQRGRGAVEGQIPPALTPVLTGARMPGATKPFLTQVPTHTHLPRTAKRLLKPLLPLVILTPLLPLVILVMPLQMQQSKAGDCAVYLWETKQTQQESETQCSHKQQLWKTPAAPSLMSLYILSVTYRKQNSLAELSKGVRL